MALLVLLLTLVLHVVPALFGEVLPDDLEGGIGIVGGDRGSRLSSLEDDLDELGLVLSVAVVGEPVVEVLATDSPSVGDSFGAEETDAFDVGDEDGFGGGKGEVVFLDDQQFGVDGDL